MLAARRSRLTPSMIGLKRYIRPGLVVSAIGHLGVLIVGLLLVGANAFHAPLPDAMVVEVVTPDELPRFEGTPSGLQSSGSQTPSPADGKGAVTRAPPPEPRPQPQQETQQRPNPQRETKEVPAPRPPAPEAMQAELVRTEKTEPERQINRPSGNLLHHRRRNRHQNNQTSPKRSHNTWLSADRSAAASPRRRLTPTRLATIGPRRSGNVSAYVRRWRREFEPGEVTIKVRVSFNRDGSVASPPRLLLPAPSAKQQALMESVVDALERCQPFTMLPPEKFKQWKTMVFYVTPLLAHW